MMNEVDNAEPTGDLPEGTLPFQGNIGADSILLGMTADHQLGNHDRQADDKDTDQIDKDKSTTAVLTGDVGELPDIAEADGTAGSSENEAEARGPLTSSLRLRHEIFL